MNQRPWIYSAITFLLVANVLLGRHFIIGILLLSFWIIRIALLRNKHIFLQVFLLSLFFVGSISFYQHQDKTKLKEDDSIFLIYPELSSIKIDGDLLTLKGTIQKTNNKNVKEKIVVRYYIQTNTEKEEWLHYHGESHLLVEGEVSKPASPSNFNQFNYEDYLKRNKIYWQLSADKITFLNHSNLAKPLFYQVDKIRYQIIRYLDQSFHEKISGYLRILFMADRSGLAKQIQEGYRALGVIHLFSISGFHISYLARAIRRFFLRIGLSHERTNLILVVILPVYGLLAGLSVSVFRAVTQTTLLIGSTMLNKEIDTLDAWSLAMILSLIINPYRIFELSFQLSYSLSGLFILMGKQEWIAELSSINQSFLFSLLSLIVSIPILSYHFYEIAWISLFANILFIPFFTYMLFPALVFLFLTSFIFQNTSAFLLLNKLLAFILIKLEVLIATITQRYHFSFILGRLPQIVLVIIILCIIHLLKKIEQNKKPSLFTLLMTTLLLSWNRISPMGYVVMLDVGQGDAVLIKEPITRKVTLIDTGGKNEWREKESWQERETSFSIGKDIVVPSLKSFGIASIDRLYITHAHLDHMGEVDSIAAELKIKEIAATRASFQDEQVFKKITPLTKSKLVELQPKMKLSYPVSNTILLHPIKDYPSKNDQSLVLYVKMGEDSWLFTGDIEEAAEKDLIQEYPSLHIDYLKVAHHGSKTSSIEAFIDHINPKVALVSVGENNSFGHPNMEVIETFKKRNIKIYTTGENGAIKISYLKLPLIKKWLSKEETVN